MISVRVTSVKIPAWSTIGYGEGYGWDATGRMFNISFVGDHRPMRDLGLALSATGPGEDPPIAMVPDDAITAMYPVKEGQA